MSLPRPDDYGAKPDRKTDNTVALQKWLDAIPQEGGKGYGDGQFLYTGKLTVSGETDIRGSGMRSFRLYNPTVDQAKFVNRNGADDASAPCIDQNISLRDMCFEGDPKAPINPGVGNVDLFTIQNLELKRVLLLNSRKFGCIFGYNHGMKIHDCEVDNWGDNRPFTGATGTWSSGTAFFGWRPNFNVSVKRNWLHGGFGIGMWWATEGRWLVCEDNLVDGCQEAGYFGWPQNSRVRRNKAFHVRRVDVSGHGMESVGMETKAGTEAEFIDNEAHDCDGAGFYFTDMSAIRVEGNRASLVNCGDPTAFDESMAAYVFRTATANPALVGSNITFKRNQATAGGKVNHAVVFHNTTGNPLELMSDIDSSENDWGDEKQWLQGNVGLYPTPETVVEKSLIGKLK